MNPAPPPHHARSLLAGFLTGFGGGLASLGGGTLLIPMLTAWLGLSQHQARGTAMVIAGFTAVSGALSYGLYGSVRWDSLLWAGVPALICAPLAARLSMHWPERLLRQLFSVVLLLGAVALFARDGLSGGFASGCPHSWLIMVGVITGSVAGVVGISGGPVLAPLFVIGLGMPQQMAQGSSLTARIPAILSGVWEDQREGLIRWQLVPLLALGDVVGTLAGAHLALQLPEPLLRGCFAFLLMLLGLYELFGGPRYGHAKYRPHGNYP